MTARERFQRLLGDREVDRFPWALWRHFPHEEDHPAELARATIRFHQEHDFDLWKIGPRSSYQIRDYGIKDEFRGDHLGRPAYLNTVIRAPGDWRKLEPLDPERGWLRQIVEAVASILRARPPEKPALMTVFSPLTQAKNLCGLDHLAAHWQSHPDEVRRGLAVLAESTRRLLVALRPLPLDGIFYVIQECGDARLRPLAGEGICGPLDRALLGENAYWLNLLHLHGPVLDFHAYARYPVSILHWDERASGVWLEQGAEMFGGIVSGGLPWPARDTGDVRAVRLARERVCQRMLGRRFMLAADCVIPWQAERVAIRAACPVAE